MLCHHEIELFPNLRPGWFQFSKHIRWDEWGSGFWASDENESLRHSWAQRAPTNSCVTTKFDLHR